MDTLPRHLRGHRALVLGRQPHALHMVAAADFRPTGLPMPRGSRSRRQTPRRARPRSDHHPRRPADLLSPARAWYPSGLHAPMVHDPRGSDLLRRQLRGPLGLMRALQQQGEPGDPRQTNQLLGPVDTTLTERLQNQTPA
jgi:hypothetical protein